MAARGHLLDDPSASDRADRVLGRMGVVMAGAALALGPMVVAGDVRGR